MSEPLAAVAERAPASPLRPAPPPASADAPIGLVLAVAGAAFVLYLVYLTVGLHFDLLRSDVLTYWRESFRWRSPFSTWWVPGYALTIAAVRALTLGQLPAVAIMVSISGAAYLTGVATMQRIARQAGYPQPFAVALLFAFWPFVGLTYSVYPLSDMCAIALFLLAVLALLESRWARLALFAGLAMVFHKAMWFFVPPLLLVPFLRDPASRRWLVLAPVPLLVWIVAGYFRHGDPLWFLRWGFENLIVSRGRAPVFDGVLTPLVTGQFSKVAKGVVVVGVLAITMLMTAGAVRGRLWAGAAVCVALLAMIAVINSYEIWVTVCFSKLLAVPLCLLVASGRWRPRPATRPELVTGAVVLVASNLAYGLYIGYFFRH